VSTVPPIRREIRVDADPATAFEVFTARIGQWWPVSELSVFGSGAVVAFTDGQIIERAADGRSSCWGSVIRWEPGTAVAFTWHPGMTPERASQVEVTFAADGAQTLVVLEHTGWEAFDDPAAARSEYDQGWPAVLENYRDHTQQPAGETWVALLHRPGPAGPADGSVFDDPRFADHVAFLTRMNEAGYLVAAGPFTDLDGEGMTVLRLPGADQVDRAAQLATEDDVSVATGFFTVTVRPWQVLMQASEARS
jgi:uncharacterized protein YciI/uncharacterized protein YndB with AHSA1/START domain